MVKKLVVFSGLIGAGALLLWTATSPSPEVQAPPTQTAPSVTPPSVTASSHPREDRPRIGASTPSAQREDHPNSNAPDVTPTTFRMTPRIGDYPDLVDDRRLSIERYKAFVEAAKLTPEVDQQVRWHLYELQVKLAELMALSNSNHDPTKDPYTLHAKRFIRSTDDLIRSLLTPEQQKIKESSFPGLEVFALNQPLDPMS